MDDSEQSMNYRSQRKINRILCKQLADVNSGSLRQTKYTRSIACTHHSSNPPFLPKVTLTPTSWNSSEYQNYIISSVFGGIHRNRTHHVTARSVVLSTWSRHAVGDSSPNSWSGRWISQNPKRDDVGAARNVLSIGTP